MNLISDVSLHNIYIDQVLTGDENDYLDSIVISDGIDKFKSDFRSKSDLFSKMRINIWNSLHFKYLKDPLKYESLYSSYMKFSNQDSDHFLIKYKELESKFTLEFLKSNPIKIEILNGEIQVLDGAHRLALYFYKTNSKVIDRSFLDTINYNLIDLNYLPTRLRLNRLLRKNHGASFYNGWAISKKYNAGYHTFELFNYFNPGQRNCNQRLALIEERYPLNGKSIIDIGCNTGGMLFHIGSPSKTLGLDFDADAIEIANSIKKFIFKEDKEFAIRFNFHHMDLINFDPIFMKKYIEESMVDVVFLLSMGSWLLNWRDIYSFFIENQCDIVLETNNDVEGQVQLDYIAKHNVELIMLSEGSTDDISGNIGRKTYLILNNHKTFGVK